MKEVSIIGVDLAKNVFQLHGATADGTVLFRRKLSPDRADDEGHTGLLLGEYVLAAHVEIARIGRQVGSLEVTYAARDIIKYKQ